MKAPQHVHGNTIPTLSQSITPRHDTGMQKLINMLKRRWKEIMVAVAALLIALIFIKIINILLMVAFFYVVYLVVKHFIKSMN
ncbi:MAG: hypothetical protein HQL53_12220 [Magnetococcales bacterium]|nr:hypothetical protein [Magnetococcales bacterium]